MTLPRPNAFLSCNLLDLSVGFKKGQAKKEYTLSLELLLLGRKKRQATLEQNRNRGRRTMFMIRRGIARDLDLGGITIRPDLSRDWIRNRMLVGHVIIEIEANGKLWWNR